MTGRFLMPLKKKMHERRGHVPGTLGTDGSIASDLAVRPKFTF